LRDLASTTFSGATLKNEIQGRPYPYIDFRGAEHETRCGKWVKSTPELAASRE
jgi:hypothetical protein